MGKRQIKSSQTIYNVSGILSLRGSLLLVIIHSQYVIPGCSSMHCISFTPLYNAACKLLHMQFCRVWRQRSQSTSSVHVSEDHHHQGWGF